MTFGLIVTYVFSVLVFMFLYNYFITWIYGKAEKPVPDGARKRACLYSFIWPGLVLLGLIKSIINVAIGVRESSGDTDLDAVIYDRNKNKESRDRMSEWTPTGVNKRT